MIEDSFSLSELNVLSAPNMLLHINLNLDCTDCEALLTCLNFFHLYKEQATLAFTITVYNYIIMLNVYEVRRIWCCQLAASLSLKSLMHGSDLLVTS